MRKLSAWHQIASMKCWSSWKGSVSYIGNAVLGLQKRIVSSRVFANLPHKQMWASKMGQNCPKDPNSSQTSSDHEERPGTGMGASGNNIIPKGKCSILINCIPFIHDSVIAFCLTKSFELVLGINDKPSCTTPCWLPQAALSGQCRVPGRLWSWGGTAGAGHLGGSGCGPTNQPTNLKATLSVDGEGFFVAHQPSHGDLWHSSCPFS